MPHAVQVFSWTEADAICNYLDAMEVKINETLESLANMEVSR